MAAGPRTAPHAKWRRRLPRTAPHHTRNGGRPGPARTAPHAKWRPPGPGPPRCPRSPLTAADPVRSHSGAGGGAELPGVGGGRAGGGQRLQGQRAVCGRREDRQPRLVRPDGEAQHTDGTVQAAQAALPGESQRLRGGDGVRQQHRQRVRPVPPGRCPPVEEPGAARRLPPPPPRRPGRYRPAAPSRRARRRRRTRARPPRNGPHGGWWRRWWLRSGRGPKPGGGGRAERAWPRPPLRRLRPSRESRAPPGPLRGAARCRCRCRPPRPRHEAAGAAVPRALPQRRHRLLLQP